MEKEIWRDVTGYEGSYKVSNLGNVKSVDRYVTFSGGRLDGHPVFYKGKNLKPSTSRDGYLQVSLVINSKNRSFLVHRLVASAFLENPEGKETVNHIDGTKTNNRLENLEWATMLEQSDHAFSTGLYKPDRNRGVTNGRARLTENEVRQIRELNKHVFSVTEISEIYGVSKGAVEGIVSRKSWKHIV